MSKSRKQREDYYRNGLPGEVYGIWNSITKRFVYGIHEASPAAADRRLQQLNPGGWRCWRYEARRIPPEWKNAPNDRYVREAAHDR